MSWTGEIPVNVWMNLCAFVCITVKHLSRTVRAVYSFEYFIICGL